MAMRDVPEGACGAFELIEVTAPVVSLSASAYADGYVVATKAVIHVRSDTIWFRYDGVTAEAGTGQSLASGQILTLEHPHDIKNFRAIAANSNARLAVHYMR